MKSIIINGQEAGINSTGLNSIAEVVELIKGTIDPAHMITDILLDGKQLGEADWTANISSFPTAILEVETGLPENYVGDRLTLSPQVVQACFLAFREARKSFQEGRMKEGNTKLVQAVAALKAFFEWYATLLNLLPEPSRAAFSLEDSIGGLMTSSKKICQQQMYQSWWAIGETIKNEVEPELDKLEDRCRAVCRSN